MSFPAYPEYKQSGFDWLPEVPSHWVDRKIARDIPFVVGWTPPSGKDEYYDGDLPWVTIADMTQMSVQDTKSKISHLAVQDKGAKVVPAGSMLFSFKLSVGKIAFLTIDSYTNEAIAGFLPCGPLDLEYWKYAAPEFIPRYGRENIYGATLLNQELISSVRFSAPVRAEQTQIARFLNYETARIDALIEEQQRLIELLKEKRQAVISHAVTKGLDPTVPMKGSGVKWLGEVPAHWEITQIKRRCDLITDGAHISPETESGVYCFVSTRDVSDDGIDFDGCLRTSAASYEYLVKTGCQPATGDVLFSKDGTIGRTIVVGENSPDFVVASSLIIIRPNRAELLPTYLDFLCQSWVVSQQVDGFVKGAGLPRLSIQNLTKVVGVFPPLEEQALIAGFLQLQCVAARQLSSEAWRTMGLLKERRSALISAAVTGKIDVRAWQPPASVPTPKLVKEAV
ncbi:restriction endonuclease subunit S [Pseudomonas sp. WS 5021]|uniref:restriction endonuclease subunit S n=1 Tax=unclassified Pseudomonas TaxID=196821 RepID=UPI0014761A6E|nr:restriction endonuclease subunit S [Pseudomonas sp. WS 5021]NMY29299.1 restriction endonuclease subunit S [Pseudomonas sp. WS 5021]